MDGFIIAGHKAIDVSLSFPARDSIPTSSQAVVLINLDNKSPTYFSTAKNHMQGPSRPHHAIFTYEHIIITFGDLKGIAQIRTTYLNPT